MNENTCKTLICRACLTLIAPSDKFVSLNEYYADKVSSDKVLIADLIQRCIPEMDLEISKNAVICTSCYDALVNMYVFKLKCFKTEERIYSYIEESNLRLGDTIDLLNIVNQNTGDENEIVFISDSDSDVHIISSSEWKNDDTTNIREETAEENNNERPTFSPSCPRMPYLCAKCPYRTYRKDLLEQHVNYNCRNKMNKYKCNFCSYESVKKRHLARHKFCHVGGKPPYFCGICERMFSQKGNVRLHILYKHSVPDFIVPYKCTVKDCDASFDRKSDFNLHIVKHVTYRPFTCQLCNKGFFNEAQWDMHMEEIHDLC